MRAVALVVGLGLTICVAPLAADAQQPGKVYRIGILMEVFRVADVIGPNPRTQLGEAFLGGLREFGYVEGQNVVIERRSAEGKRERLPVLAAELARLKVDVIVASSTTTARAARNATSTIPIVMVGIGDPVGTQGREARRSASRATNQV